MIVKNIGDVLIWSENYRALADWYIEKLDLTPVDELNHPEDTGIGFQVGKVYLWVGQHSKVKGKNQDPYRIMIDFDVDSVSETYQELLKRGVDFLVKPFKAPTFAKYFATFTDLDGNILQLIGDK